MTSMTFCAWEYLEGIVRRNRPTTCDELEIGIRIAATNISPAYLQDALGAFVILEQISL